MAVQITAYDDVVYTISPEGIEVSDGSDRVMLEAELFRAGATGSRAEVAKGTLNMLMDYFPKAAAAASSSDGLGLDYRDLKAASLEPKVYAVRDDFWARSASDKDLVDAYRRLPSKDNPEVDGAWLGEMDNDTRWRQRARQEELDRRGLRLDALSSQKPDLRIETLPPEVQAEWRRIDDDTYKSGLFRRHGIDHPTPRGVIPPSDWDKTQRQLRETSWRKGAEKGLYDRLPREGAEQRLGEQPRPVPLPRPAPAPEGVKLNTDSPRSETYSDYQLRKLQSPGYSYTREELTGDGEQSGLPKAGEQLRGGEGPRPTVPPPRTSQYPIASPSSPDSWDVWAPDRSLADQRLRELQGPGWSSARYRGSGIFDEGFGTGLPKAGEQLRGGEQPRPVPPLADRAGNRGPPITQPLSQDEVRAFWAEELTQAGQQPSHPLHSVSTAKDYWVERGEDAYDAYDKAKRALLNGG